MDNFIETGVAAVGIGIGATAVMDVWLLALKRAGVPTQNFAMLGRWIGHLPQQRIHSALAKAAPVKGEAIIGWSAHYAIGIAFAAIMVAVNGQSWIDRPSVLPALLTGIVTVAAPLFILQPAMGSGIASTKTPKPVLNTLKSVANHSVFGLGMYAAAVVGAAIRG